MQYERTIIGTDIMIMNIISHIEFGLVVVSNELVSNWWE